MTDKTRQLTDAEAIAEFVWGGSAIFTLVSKKTGTRYTYRVSAPKDGSKTMRFVGLLTGPDNTGDYSYLGFLKSDRLGMIPGKKGNPNHPAYKGVDWFLRKIASGDAADEQVEFWHAGRCCRCARVLTNPASIESGIGPECAKKET